MTGPAPMAAVAEEDAELQRQAKRQCLHLRKFEECLSFEKIALGVDATFPEKPERRTVSACTENSDLRFVIGHGFSESLARASHSMGGRYLALHEVALRKARVHPGHVCWVDPEGLCAALAQEEFQSWCEWCREEAPCWPGIVEGLPVLYCGACWHAYYERAFEGVVGVCGMLPGCPSMTESRAAALWPAGGVVLTIFKEDITPGCHNNVGMLYVAYPKALGGRLSAIEFLELLTALGTGMVHTILDSNAQLKVERIDALRVGALALEECCRTLAITAVDAAEALLHGILRASTGGGAAEEAACLTVQLCDSDGAFAAAWGRLREALGREPGHPCLSQAASLEPGCSTSAAPAGPCKISFLHDADPALWEQAKAALARVVADGCGTAAELHDFVVRLRVLAASGDAWEAHEDFDGLHALRLGAEIMWPTGGEDSAPRLMATSRLLAKSAAALPEVFPGGLAVLRRGDLQPRLLSRRQCLSILSAMVLGLIPPQQEPADKATLPSFDCCCFLVGSRRWSVEQSAQNVRCLLNYLDQLARLEAAARPAATEGGSSGNGVSNFLDHEYVSFTRRVASPSICMRRFWLEGRPLGPFVFEGTDGTIEDDCRALQADFANKYLGGGVLNGTLGQEEIHFLLCPECMCSSLFVERMKMDEAVFIVGALRYSDAGGWHEFQFKGPVNPEAWPALDGHGRRDVHVVALDAVRYSWGDEWNQYKEQWIRRELAKAHVACLGDPSDAAEPPRTFATGNWGSGAFRGDPQLKALIQWVAASTAGRSVRYYPFDDARVSRLGKVVERIRAIGADCQQLFMAITAGAPEPGRCVFDDVLARLGAEPLPPA